jgi:hypothetical protein
MITLENNTICIYFFETQPQQRLNKMAMAITAAFRWRGNVPTEKEYPQYIDGENMVWLAKIMEGILTATVSKKNEVRIQFDVIYDSRDYLMASINAAIRWYGCLDDSNTYSGEGEVDRQNLIELCYMQSLLLQTQYLTPNENK